MTLSTQPVKGARDFYPEDMRLQTYIFNIWRTVCERYGYEEYDAPILEPTELYLSKGNQEIIDEQTYSFTDRGGRNVTLRTEMTPTVSRLVAGRKQELPYPLRLYSIPQCWRYERMQRGRGREFYQLNVDIFGVDDLSADIEIIELADAIMQRFGAKRDMYQIKINSRMLMDALFKDTLKVDATQADSLRRLIDKKAKMEQAEFIAKLDGILSPSQREAGETELLLSFLSLNNLENLPESLIKTEPVAKLRQVLLALNEAGITNVEFDPSLMRGFDYYTDVAFEVFDTDPENNRSMFGGGRYDGLVGSFGNGDVTAVGLGMGDITLKNFLESHKLLPQLTPATELYVCAMSNGAEKVVRELREMEVNVAVDDSNRKLDKQLKTAEKLGVRYVLFVGENEIKSQQFTLKNLKTGNQEAHSLQRIVTIIKDARDSN